MKAKGRRDQGREAVARSLVRAQNARKQAGEPRASVIRTLDAASPRLRFSLAPSLFQVLAMAESAIIPFIFSIIKSISIIF